MSSLHSAFISLLSGGLGTTNNCDIPVKVDWHQLMILSQQHGVESIVFDGIERLITEGKCVNIDI